MSAVPDFKPNAPDAAGVVSYIHIGDLHMTAERMQNQDDLAAMIEQINEHFAASVSFVYLPGDVAEDGSTAAYARARALLNRLRVPWCAIVGDHDVHEKSFRNFLAAVSPATHYAFTVGRVRFVAMNAFDVPDPGSFAVLPEQMDWCEQQLAAATAAGQTKVLLLHCYPSELKTGSEPLRALIDRYQVRLVEMGHTHYNELAHDGRTTYAATRSTGQVEEGAVGFSVTSLDGEAVSWRFFETGTLPAVMITAPADARLQRDAVTGVGSELRVRAKVWSHEAITAVRAECAGRQIELRQVEGSLVWEGLLAQLPAGVLELRVSAIDAQGTNAKDAIQVVVGSPLSPPQRQERDLENVLEAWPEHGLLGTQLGPNKNGRKW